MNTEEAAQVASLLLRESLFQGFTVDQINQVVEKIHLEGYPKGKVIYQEGTAGKAFFIIFRGKARATHLIRGRPRLLGTLSKGDYFGEESLIYGRPRASTLTTVEDTVLLSISRDDFKQLLAEYPDLGIRLAATAESRRIARSTRFSWLGENEVIYLITRKHEFFLAVSLFLPIVLLLIAIAMTIWGTLSDFLLMALSGLGVFAGGIFWAVWNYVDWANDYYIVTNQRVVWLEKIVALYDSRREAPLNSILSTEVTSSQVGRIFNYGNINVRTYTGAMLMRNASKPYLFADTVDRFRSRAIVVSRESEVAAFESELEKALRRQLDPAHVEVPKLPVSSIKKTIKPPPQPGPFRQVLNTFLKVRYQQSGTITYRKHWFILLQKTWVPLLALLIWLAGQYLLWKGGLFNLVSATLDVLGLMLILAWLVYHYWDWNNDIYRLTPTQIFDIERKPLGQEQKKSASLDSPDFRVEHERANLLGILLNFGNVIVSIGQTKFTFNGVYNPDQVHQDVSDYREALLRRKRAQEETQNRDRMVDFLVSFYNQSERLEDLENGGGGGGESG